MASIFRDDLAEQGTSVKAGGLPPAFTLVSSLASSTLKKKGRYVTPKRQLTFNGLHCVLQEDNILLIFYPSQS
jgi:hypothetical protein